MKKEFFGVAQKAQSSPVPNKSHDGGSTVESMTIMSKKDDHDRFRRLFQPAFTNVALKAQHPLIASHADLVVARLTESHAAGDNINVTELATYYSVDMMSELVFGHSLGLLDGNPQYVSWVHAMLSGLRWVVLTAVLMQVPLLGSLLHALATGPMKGIVGAHYRLASELVDRRLDQKPEQAGKPDVWSFVIGRQQQSEKRGKGVKGLTRDDMHVAASMLMIVGTETSATVLCGVMYYLGQKANRHVHDKLALEIRSTIRHSEEVHNDPGLLVRLPYLNAVLQEGLRMYMPGGITPRVVPEGGATICGEYVPAGVSAALLWSRITFPHRSMRWRLTCVILVPNCRPELHTILRPPSTVLLILLEQASFYLRDGLIRMTLSSLGIADRLYSLFRLGHARALGRSMYNLGCSNDFMVFFFFFSIC